jgi:hypothetical protein
MLFLFFLSLITFGGKKEHICFLKTSSRKTCPNYQKTERQAGKKNDTATPLTILYTFYNMLFLEGLLSLQLPL